jgi:1-acyl-sn-glycerol-3-phosphate acyltransferase
MTVIRSTIFFVYFVVVSVGMAVLCSPGLLGPRAFAAWVGRTWSKLLFWGLRVIAGTRFEVRGRLPPAGVLIAAKHMSMWDTCAIFTLLGDPAIVLKRDLQYIPFYGWYLWKAGMIAINRDGKAHALRKMAADARAELASGRSIAIFPEGTRVKPGALPHYKSGVAALYGQLDVACVPVALNSGLFWTGPIGFLKKKGTIVIEFLDPIAPGLRRHEFMTRLESAIETKTSTLIAEGRAQLARRSAP